MALMSDLKISKLLVPFSPFSTATLLITVTVKPSLLRDPNEIPESPLFVTELESIIVSALLKSAIPSSMLPLTILPLIIVRVTKKLSIPVSDEENTLLLRICVSLFTTEFKPSSSMPRPSISTIVLL